jgi:putative effector of murein hydrolase LrgA (UPF0299 family)
MPFWPDSGWGIAYVSILLLSSIFAIRSPRPQYRIAAILWVGWLLTRTIVYVDPGMGLLWVLLDVAFIAAFVLEGSTASLLSAAIFIAPLNVDIVALFWNVQFDAAASVFEAAGYFAMMFMTGAAYDTKGTGGHHIKQWGGRWIHRMVALPKRAPARPTSRPTR